MHAGFPFHYVEQTLPSSDPLFGDCGHIAEFERCLVKAAKDRKARVHAFCWGESTLNLLVEVSCGSIGGFLQSVRRRVARVVGTSQAPVRRVLNHQVKVRGLNSRAEVLEVVRVVHLVPVSLGLVQDPLDYSMSSHCAYLGRSSIPWLTTGYVLGSMAVEESLSIKVYREFMCIYMVPLSSSTLHPATPEAPSAPGLSSAEVRACATLDELVVSISRFLGRPRSILSDDTHDRMGATARSLVAWHARQLGLATLGEVSRMFGRTPSALVLSIQTARSRHPELFQPDFFHYCPNK